VTFREIFSEIFEQLRTLSRTLTLVHDAVRSLKRNNSDINTVIMVQPTGLSESTANGKSVECVSLVNEATRRRRRRLHRGWRRHATKSAELGYQVGKISQQNVEPNRQIVDLLQAFCT